MSVPIKLTKMSRPIYKILQKAAREGATCPTNSELGRAVGLSRGRASLHVQALEAHGLFKVQRNVNVRRISFPDGTSTANSRGTKSFRPAKTRCLAENTPSLPKLTIYNKELHQRWHAAHEMAHATLEEEILAGDYD